MALTAPWKWQGYVWACLWSSLVTMLFGLDTGIIGPITAMPAFTSRFGNFSPTIHGLIVACHLLPGGIIAAFAGGLSDYFGRETLVAAGALVHAAGMLIWGFSVNLAMVVVARVICGMGLGLFMSNVSVYIVEVSPPRGRGVRAAMAQLLLTLGLVIGFFMCYGLVAGLAPESEWTWRTPPYVVAGLGVVLGGAVWTQPPSPRWLSIRGRVDEARRTFRGFRLAFSGPYRGRSIFACFVLTVQQFSGIDGVLFYAPKLFESAGFAEAETSFLASGISAICIMVSTIPATLLADHWGRRTATMWGGVAIAVEMLLMAALYFAGQGDAGGGRWVVIVMIYLFAVTYSVTWAVCMRIGVSESLPTGTRSSAMALAQSCNWLGNFTIALVTPILLSASVGGTYLFFSICTMLGSAVMYVYMIETKGTQLERIDELYVSRKAERRTEVQNARGLAEKTRLRLTPLSLRDNNNTNEGRAMSEYVTPPMMAGERDSAA
uniref:Major facilitator superfamily (MFS) profile domain-containing protein n=1 Tax=Pyricularia oryzae (strain P131) TaxID=1143193 RepID=L7J4L6_PYRO1